MLSKRAHHNWKNVALPYPYDEVNWHTVNYMVYDWYPNKDVTLKKKNTTVKSLGNFPQNNKIQLFFLESLS